VMVASRVSVLGSSSVEQAYTIASWIKPAMLSKPTLSVHGSSR